MAPPSTKPAPYGPPGVPLGPGLNSMNRLDLKDRIAIVTAAARGIGYAVAERVLRSGGAVSVWDRDAQRLGEVRKSRCSLAERGVTLNQASVRNVGTCRPDVKGEAQAHGLRKINRTNTGHRDGGACSRNAGLSKGARPKRRPRDHINLERNLS